MSPRALRRPPAWTTLVPFAVGAAATARVLVWPPRSRLEASDAVLVLGPPHDRLPEALRLIEENMAPTLVVAIDDKRQTDVKVPEGVELVCFRPAPHTTRGEARYIAGLARQRGWESVVVVSSVPQQTRARLRIGRCFSGRLAVVGVPPHGPLQWAFSIFYEWAALAKALVWERGC